MSGEPDIRRAERADIDEIAALLLEARAHLKRLGVDQWQGPYPDGTDVLLDLEDGTGYVLTDGGEIAGYACISFDGEPSYEEIDGAWLSLQPYGVIHRLTVGDRWKGRGLTARLFQYAEALCAERGVRSLKIDTHPKNAAMRHVVEKNGYLYCGVIQVEDGARLAYEKLI